MYSFKMANSWQKTIVHNNHLYEVDAFTLKITNLAKSDTPAVPIKFDYPFKLLSIGFINGCVELYAAEMKFAILEFS